MAHSAPALVGQLHADQDVSGHPNAGDLLALAALDLGDGLHGDLYVEDVRLHVQGAHSGQEVGLDPVLIPRVGVNDEPVTLLEPQCGAEGGLILDVLVDVRLPARIDVSLLSHLGVGLFGLGLLTHIGLGLFGHVEISLLGYVDALLAVGGQVG